jgi:hypothetical protein
MTENVTTTRDDLVARLRRAGDPEISGELASVGPDAPRTSPLTTSRATTGPQVYSTRFILKESLPSSIEVRRDRMPKYLNTTSIDRALSPAPRGVENDCRR